MKYRFKAIIALLFFVNLSFGQTENNASEGEKENNVKIDLKESKLTIKGTSTLHDWESNAESTSSNIVINGFKDAEIEKLSLIVDVNSIKNTKGSSMMDKLTLKALKESEYPKIIYEFINAEILTNQEKELKVKLIGNLTIAGKTNKVSIVTSINKSESNIILKGSHKLKMTDYGVEPPTALFGTIETGDEITIEFSIEYQLL